MQFAHTITIERHQQVVWCAFTDPRFLRRWQPRLQTVEQLSGAPGQIGAVARLTYREAGRDVTLIETVQQRSELYTYVCSYEAAPGPSIIHNRFDACTGGQTNWTMTTRSRYRGIWSVLGPLIWVLGVRRFKADMIRFKAEVERGDASPIAFVGDT